MPAILVTDAGTHFGCTLISVLTRRFRARHYITTAYSPWVNCIIERVSRELLRLWRVLMSEVDPTQLEWATLRHWCRQMRFSTAYPLQRCNLPGSQATHSNKSRLGGYRRKHKRWSKAQTGRRWPGLFSMRRLRLFRVTGWQSASEPSGESRQSTAICVWRICVGGMLRVPE